MSPVMTEFEEGYNAYFRGVPKSANPYDCYRYNHKTWWIAEEWDDGWDKAQKDDDDFGVPLMSLTF